MSVLITQCSQNRYHSHTINHGHSSTVYCGPDGGGGWEHLLCAGAAGSRQWYSLASVENYNGSSGANGDSNNQEARSENFTYKLWKRIN